MRSFVVKDKRRFMQALLTKDCFDHFLLSEVTVKKGILLTIDGHETNEQIAEYGSMREIVYRFIQGSQTPSYMKFVLLSPENLPGVASRSVNIIFRRETMTVTSGFSYREFVPDKIEEGNWDQWVEQYLQSLDVEIE